MAGFIADALSPLTSSTTMLESVFQTVTAAISDGFFLEIIVMIIIIGKCIFSAFNFVIQLVVWFFKDFILWSFIGKTPASDWKNLFNPKRGDEQTKVCLLCWLIRYIIVIAYKITALPKCFLWYFLDTAGWVLYLPFRFIFWVIDWMLNIGSQNQKKNKRRKKNKDANQKPQMGLVDMEHKTWDFLDELDYFLHGRPGDNYFMYQYKPSDPKVDGNGKPLVNGNDPNTMNLGFHFIHFPNSVMRQCYSISPYGLLKFPPFPLKALEDFLSCAIHPF